MSEVKDTLQDRGEVYGENWHTYCALKDIVDTKRFSSKRQYCMDMILMKISRLAEGDVTDKDTWHDIAGYATLAESDPT